MNVPAAPVWPFLRSAATAFCPPLGVAQEEPRRLAIALRDPASGGELLLRYRSERGLFLRTYYLMVEADVPGDGPAEAGELVLRRRRLGWRRPKPRDAGRWSERLGSRELFDALRPLQVERLSLRWRPEALTWRLALETLSGSVTVTFFPPLETPNPLLRSEADAIRELVETLHRAAG